MMRKLKELNWSWSHMMRFPVLPTPIWFLKFPRHVLLHLYVLLLGIKFVINKLKCEMHTLFSACHLDDLLQELITPHGWTLRKFWLFSWFSNSLAWKIINQTLIDWTSHALVPYDIFMRVFYPNQIKNSIMNVGVTILVSNIFLLCKT